MAIETPCKNCPNECKRKDCKQEEFEECMAVYYLQKLNMNNRRIRPEQIVDRILSESFCFHEFDMIAVEMVKYMANK